MGNSQKRVAKGGPTRRKVLVTAPVPQNTLSAGVRATALPRITITHSI